MWRSIAASEAARDLGQQLVTGIVPEGVVDLLEAVEVEHEHGQHAVRARRPGEGLVEAVAEQGAVGETGQSVVEGLARQLLFQADALGDVTRVEDDPANAPVLAQVADVGLEMAPFTEAVGHPEHDLRGFGAGLRAPHQRAVVGVHDVLEARAEQLRLRATRHADDRLAGVTAATATEDEDQVGRGTHQAAEMRGLAARGGDEREREQQRDDQACPAEHDLQRDEVAHLAVRGGGDRPRGVQRHVRRERREHPEATDGVGRRQSFMGSQRQRDRASGEP